MSRGTYAGKFQCLEQPGPLLCVAIIARSVDVPWRDEFRMKANSAAWTWLDNKLSLQNLMPLRHHFETDLHDRTWKLLGVALLAAWVLMPANAQPLTAKTLSAKDRDILHAVRYGSSDRPCIGVLDYPLRDAVLLQEPVPLSPCAALDQTNDSLDLPSHSAFFWRALQHGQAQTQEQPAGRARAFRDVLAEWKQRYQLAFSGELPALIGWRCFTPIAELLLRKLLWGDLQVLWSRMPSRYAAKLLTDGPPAALLKRYLSLKALGKASSFGSIELFHSSDACSMTWIASNSLSNPKTSIPIKSIGTASKRVLASCLAVWA